MNKAGQIDDVLKTAKKIHMIGIGGSGMSPLAEILIEKGYKLSGSDNNEGDNITKMRELGVTVHIGHDAKNIDGAEMVVYTAALLPGNPELEKALEVGTPVFDRAALFGAISRHFSDTISVTGTHGKTTTTAMMTQAYLQSGADPSAVIGGVLPLINSHGRVGESDTLIAEACEFKDTYLQLDTNTAVILNVDEDHLDYFKNLENIIKSFHTFARGAKSTIIYNGDDENTLKAIAGIENKKMISFGFSDTNDFYAKDIKMINGAFPQYTVMYKGKELGKVGLSVPGNHNISNSLAVIACAYNSGLDIKKVLVSISEFMGAGRRFEVLGKFNGITIADDYAHHPLELKVTLEAVMAMGYREVWAVFQPFTYSRTFLLFDDFVDVLQIPNNTVITEIMGSREVNTYNIHGKDLADKVPSSTYLDTFDEVANFIIENAKAGDLVITLGCGDIYKAARKIIERYNA